MVHVRSLSVHPSSFACNMKLNRRLGTRNTIDFLPPSPEILGFSSMENAYFAVLNGKGPQQGKAVRCANLRYACTWHTA